jgi:hypothetical protein
MNTQTVTVVAGSESIKLTLEDIKGLIGLISITFLLDGKPLKPVPLGGSDIFGVSLGQHTIQVILKARSFATFFITVTRSSEILTVTVAPNTQVAVTATYNRTWGKFELNS